MKGRFPGVCAPPLVCPTMLFKRQLVNVGSLPVRNASQKTFLSAGETDPGLSLWHFLKGIKRTSAWKTAVEGEFIVCNVHSSPPPFKGPPCADWAGAIKIGTFFFSLSTKKKKKQEENVQSYEFACALRFYHLEEGNESDLARRKA